MKKREKRRCRTERYQNRQIRLESISQQYQFYDPDRYFQTERARKHKFYCELAGRVMVVLYWWEFRTYEEYFTPQRLGRLRNQSWRYCGRTHCPVCGNPRRMNNCYKTKVTKAERLADLKLKEDLNEYLKGDYNEEVTTNLQKPNH